ncbi:SUMF1/EgtB/PvdO family nonheme iron enzyme [Oceanicoccus sp. KOV_DT_Chl]|uniref:formylglycine-generating enzyme family protein n=1 Tax=Oceanicoccus sp. KOV_DT_Chl TaxID=1904639 RepID=UPI000C7A962B|nr:SUMF1/EgtB/PvdO family nonheme iron enzyme [Oceanicoccus sp. KOV_DT_Chl]
MIEIKTLRPLWLVLFGVMLSACATPNNEPNPYQRMDMSSVSEADRQILRRLVANMVILPAGEFQMGDIDNLEDDSELQPVRTVTLRAFAMSRYEVTFEQYDLYARMTGAELPSDRWGRGNRPVIDVTWYDAVDFAQWVAAQTGLALRLPSEAEWEYAARAGSDKAFSFGSDAHVLCEYANIADQNTDIGWRYKHCSDGFETTAPVGSYKANAFGLYDMHGNVWEWLGDCWSRNYKNAPADGRHWGSSNCDEHSQRGGSWFYGATEAQSFYRAYGENLDKSVTLGFRLAQDL